MQAHSSLLHNLTPISSQPPTGSMRPPLLSMDLQPITESALQLAQGLSANKQASPKVYGAANLASDVCYLRRQSRFP